jgi:hypothetical protein
LLRIFLKLTLAALRALEAVRADMDMASLTWGRCGGIVHFLTHESENECLAKFNWNHNFTKRARMFDGNSRQYNSKYALSVNARAYVKLPLGYSSTRLEMGYLGTDV